MVEHRSRGLAAPAGSVDPESRALTPRSTPELGDGRSVTGVWDPPRGPARITGGVLGVLAGEAWRGPRGGWEPPGPVSAALLGVCDYYAGEPVAPDEPYLVGHEGVPGLAWLLPVAVAQDEPVRQQGDVAQLAADGDLPAWELPACMTYVALAARLFAGAKAPDAIKAATRKPAAQAIRDVTVRYGASCRPEEPLCGAVPVCGSDPADCPNGRPVWDEGPLQWGVGAADSLAAGIWALSRPEPLADVIAALTAVCEPWVVAAAGGLLGLRDACSAIPADWHHRFRRHGDGELADIAAALLTSRAAQTADFDQVGAA